MTLTAKDIDRIIREDLHWGTLWFSQLRIGTGHGDDAERTMDMWGMQPCKPWDRICVEIKISRGDFRRDIRQPMKQRRARLLANQFYFAAPAGLIMPEDLPTWAGLLEIHEDSPDRSGIKRDWLDVKVSAPWLDSSAPTWRFVGVLARLAAKEIGRAGGHSAGASSVEE